MEDYAAIYALQLAEVELLECMYCKPGEFSIADRSVLADAKDVVDHRVSMSQFQSLPQLSFSVKICPFVQPHDTEQSKVDKVIEIATNLPLQYPYVHPHVLVISSSLSKTGHQQFREDLDKYIEELPLGELMFTYIIQWIQDNASAYILQYPSSTLHTSTVLCSKDQNTKRDKTFSRLWIYSHHIYNKFKRKSILDFASELKLTGFCMPGKPGVIAVEGYKNDAEEFWHRIRNMQWKKICLKDREDISLLDSNADMDSLRKFEGFHENIFDARQGKGREAHGDLGKLYTFLEQKQCGHIFLCLFGVEGKETNRTPDDGLSSESD